MIERAVFVEGINRIATSVRQVADAAAQGVYLDVFSPLMDTEEWDRFARWCASTTPWVTEPRYRTFPSVPELHEALRAFRGAPPMLAEATEAYERVLAAGTYTPEGGTTWTYRGVREKCGVAAAEAFMASGGGSAWANTWDEAKRRERFLAAYAEAVRDDPSAALLPAGPEQKALPSGEQEPTREEAGKVIERLRDLAGVAEAPPKSTAVVVTDERLEALRRQAAAIQEAP